jgi:hypothetical protein
MCFLVAVVERGTRRRRRRRRRRLERRLFVDLILWGVGYPVINMELMYHLSGVLYCGGGGIRVSSMVFEFEGAIIYSKNRGNPETFT